MINGGIIDKDRIAMRENILWDSFPLQVTQFGSNFELCIKGHADVCR